MHLIGRIIIITFALLVAFMAAGVTLAIGVMGSDWGGVDSDAFERIWFFGFAFLATSYVGAVALLPALLLAVLAEAARIRSFLYYGVGGALIGLASFYGSDISSQLENTTDIVPVGHSLQLAAAAGIVGGLVYWLIAGRNAGRGREHRQPSF
jgi:hypothetical protein